MNDKYAGEKLSHGLQYTTDQAETTACRKTALHILKCKARELHEEANRLENLAQIMELMPKEIESALYPLIEHYIYSKNR